MNVECLIASVTRGVRRKEDVVERKRDPITERRTALNVEEARRVLALRERLRGWRPVNAAAPWERGEYVRRLVPRRAA